MTWQAEGKMNLATGRAPFTVQTTAPADLQGFSKRMMGFEPTTFCMATRPDPWWLDLTTAWLSKIATTR
jgi:hypothetical protein